MLDSQLQYFFEGIYGVLASNWVSFVEADVVVGGKHDLEDVFLGYLSKFMRTHGLFCRQKNMFSYLHPGLRLSRVHVPVLSGVEELVCSPSLLLTFRVKVTASRRVPLIWQCQVP